MSARIWTAEEIAWGRECLAAGDSLEDIADGARCTVQEVVANIGTGRFTPRQREVLSLYTSGCTFAEIEWELDGSSSKIPGKRPASMITTLRRNGADIPYRREA